MAGDRPDSPVDGGDADAGTPAEAAERIHAELAATEELPVEREASRWIGEAQAVAGDAASAGLDAAVVRERVAHVRELLSHVDGTGEERADEHVERARALAAAAEGTAAGGDDERGGSSAK